jgi:hypothetical protein
MEKPSTVLFCALNRKTRPEQFQLADSLSGNTQKILILTTQMSGLGWELTNGNLFSVRLFESGNRADQALIRNRGMRFDLAAFCTLTWTLTCHIAKTGH